MERVMRRLLLFYCEEIFAIGSGIGRVSRMSVCQFANDDDELLAEFPKRIDYEQSIDDTLLYFLLHGSNYPD